MPRWAIYLLIAIGAAVLIAVSGVAVLSTVINSALDPVTDVRQYPSIQPFLDAARHFPKVIPATATDVRMVYWPGLLQGSNHLELRFQLPVDEAKALISALPPASLMPPLKSTCAEQCPLETIASAEFSTPRVRNFTATCKVFVLHDTNNWNHRNFGGVLIDPETGEVIYFAEH